MPEPLVAPTSVFIEVGRLMGRAINDGHDTDFTMMVIGFPPYDGTPTCPVCRKRYRHYGAWLRSHIYKKKHFAN